MIKIHTAENAKSILFSHGKSKEDQQFLCKRLNLISNSISFHVTVMKVGVVKNRTLEKGKHSVRN